MFMISILDSLTDDIPQFSVEVHKNSKISFPPYRAITYDPP
jgi:hypothetical protein